jgi:DNA recombination protein RmuC
MVVRLSGGGRLAVDAKLPLDSYLNALEVEAAEERERLLGAHARSVRQKVKQLAGKATRAASDAARDGGHVRRLRGGVSAGALADPKLLEDAAKDRVVIATPATTFALLQAVGLAWREATLSERASACVSWRSSLCRRIAKFAEHLTNSGKGIERAAKAHNEAVGSFEGRIVPTARRMAELGVSNGASIKTPAAVETQPRHPPNRNGAQAELRLG